MTERSGGILRLVAFIVLVLALIGFGSWAGTVSGYDTPDSSQQADAIVILTGDEGRLSAGGQILQQGQAPRILISGVHPRSPAAICDPIPDSPRASMIAVSNSDVKPPTPSAMRAKLQNGSGPTVLRA